MTPLGASFSFTLSHSLSPSLYVYLFLSASLLFILSLYLSPCIYIYISLSLSLPSLSFAQHTTPHVLQCYTTCTIETVDFVWPPLRSPLGHKSNQKNVEGNKELKTQDKGTSKMNLFNALVVLIFAWRIRDTICEERLTI